jgi:peptidase E
LLNQDVIYVGGGNTSNMLAFCQVHGMGAALARAYDAGVVLCGLSAGALCWFETGVTDSFGKLSPLNAALGFLPGSFCPTTLVTPIDVLPIDDLWETVWRRATLRTWARRCILSMARWSR